MDSKPTGRLSLKSNMKKATCLFIQKITFGKVCLGWCDVKKK